jgi:hypothetical protein
MENPLSWDYLTTRPEGGQVFGPFAILYLILFTLGFLVSLFLYNDGARRYVRHGVKLRAIRRGAGIALVVFGTGLFFFAIRVLQIDPFTFGMRLWLYLSLLAVVGMLAAFAYYRRTVLPRELRAHEQRKLKQRYLKPDPATAAALARAGAARAPRADARRPARRRARR